MGLCTLVALHWWRCNTAQNLTLPWQWCAWFAVMTKLIAWCEGVPPVLPKAWMMLWDITMSSDKAATGEDAEEQSLGGVSNLDLVCSFVSFDLFDLKEPGGQGQLEKFYPRQSCTLRNLGLVIRWPQMRWEAMQKDINTIILFLSIWALKASFDHQTWLENFASRGCTQWYMEHSQAGFHWILSELGAPRQATALQMCREVIENLSGRHPRTVLLNTVAPEPPLSGTYKVDGRKVAKTWNPKQPIFKWMFGETTVSQVKVWNHPSETTILLFWTRCFGCQVKVL